ncbi:MULTISPECIES: phosphoribosylglycinamide formyltransferase [Anoxybacillus]|uniref:phosphoribosylglycinamide formyltransferase n=1 Tax=Anoxybacillus TaxID=150247 RepID=UPI0018679F49|nr:phosphoribosylglycinamide formyltransferase [Anoxybacillus flavithermus]MBE2940596.1 phosphoribosylglycinamide formyltransferase [Anoxybacillus flavithermus]MBE2943352.1 phosphoribosylglycinamide formyltransferase [Anoxybacillus flavithermus]MBE2951710.1 phosphoribosylglycinamide formyltransferase [Anoxybacillus flavithermus]MBE2954241.1 phosphoribosylglycinamide formyltransferase [Anoxybacillus flavithermus]MBE2959662.1 phosphoribosylglycinamide formyltransferase [Anoxybacillus flavithermu
MKRVAIFASGSGTNFQAIVDAVKKGDIQAEVALLVCDRPQAKVIERAMREHVPIFVFNPKQYETKQQFEREILQQLQQKEIDLVVLAGYMRLIGPTLLQAYPNRIVNIHPSLLPAFPGKDAIGQAYRYGVKVTGVTVHYVDEGMDTGPIIAQRALYIDDGEPLESVERRIHEIEHVLYPQVIQQLLTEKGSTKNEKTSNY